MRRERGRFFTALFRSMFRKYVRERPEMFLSEAAVRERLSYRQLIPAMKQALIDCMRLSNHTVDCYEVG
jgi:hypothetical protein